ncbi:MAG TPA: hypothetical protein VJQ82_18695, partial [Terriglobales bacterium]|nr:hypothetical protein [Terriglobales bacterium]
PLKSLSDGQPNRYHFRLGPGDLSISLTSEIKQPGSSLLPMPVELVAMKESNADEVDAYERLLGDAMHGDPMLFVREDEVEAEWSIVDPILDDRTPVHEYDPGSWGPKEADRLAQDVGGWINPKP